MPGPTSLEATKALIGRAGFANESKLLNLDRSQSLANAGASQGFV